MYNNYIFDLYGTLIDINTDEWNDDLWKKIAILYAYKGAHYTYDELNEEYDRLVQAEKKAVLKNLPTQKLLTLKLKRFSVSYLHRKALRLQKPRYFLLQRHSVATQQSTSSFMTVYLIFSTLSRQKAKRFIFSQTHSVHSQKTS